MMTARRVFAALLFLTIASYPAYMRSTRGRARTPVAPAKPRPQKSASPAAVPSSDRAAVQAWLRGMTLRDKVGQLLFIHSFGENPPTRSKAWKEYVHAIRDLRAGGVVVVNRVVSGSVRSAEPNALASFLNRLQRLSRVPLLMGADFERGASMRVSGTAKFPHLMAFGAADDPELTKGLGAATAKEARALGIQWVFAPDADVNNNPDNPIINIRSFGEDPQLVARHVQAFIRGAHSDPANRVLVTAKHFPGHGDTSVDSHMGLASLTADRGRIESVEMVPFRAAVQAGVDSIMTAHMAVPAYEPESIPATVSKNILTGVIREQLGYSGLIVTDAMDMQGLAKQFSAGEAAVRAVEAGVDVLLMPPDPDAAVKALLAAVKEGRLTEKRINASVLRILNAKAQVGLQRKKLVNLEDIADTIEAPEFAELAQSAADRAVTLVKNDGAAVPLRNPDAACYWILSESRYGQGGRRLLEEIRNRVKNASVSLLDPQMPDMELDDLRNRAGACETQVVAAFASVGAYRGTVGLSANYSSLVETLLKGPAPVVLVSLGNPYLLRGFPTVSSYLATFSPVPTSEAAAARALFGEIPTVGKLPVSIPGIAKVGDSVAVQRSSAQ